MKKIAIALAGLAVAGLALTGCGNGSSGYAPNGGGYSDWDWDQNNPSIYNNNTYCHGGTYNPQPNGMYTCYNNGVTSTPSKRPAPIIPPKSAQKAPVAPAQPKQQTQPQQKQNTAPKPPAQAPKAPPAPKAPAPPKSGK